MKIQSPLQLIASFLTVALSSAAVVACTPAAQAEVYGEPLSEARIVRIAELLETPDAFVDQRVKVEGLVEDICPMKGCWIDILEAQSSTTVRFKVEDDVIVFPAEARGQKVVAEGILRRHEMTREEAVRWLRHLAEEKGEPFDESTVDGPMSFYQIEGVGAEVHGD